MLQWEAFSLLFNIVLLLVILLIPSTPLSILFFLLSFRSLLRSLFSSYFPSCLSLVPFFFFSYSSSLLLLLPSYYSFHPHPSPPAPFILLFSYSSCSYLPFPFLLLPFLFLIFYLKFPSFLPSVSFSPPTYPLHPSSFTWHIQFCVQDLKCWVEGWEPQLGTESCAQFQTHDAVFLRALPQNKRARNKVAQSRLEPVLSLPHFIFHNRFTFMTWWWGHDVPSKRQTHKECTATQPIQDSQE